MFSGSLASLLLLLLLLARTVDAQGALGVAAEMEALDQLYSVLGGASWTVNLGWSQGSTNSNPCGDSWPGLECKLVAGAVHVTAIALPSNNLVGALPAGTGVMGDRGINDFQYLTTLWLADNALSGTMPVITIPTLKVLNVGLNTALGGKLPTVPVVDPVTNPAGGPITQLHLEGCAFTGTIPEAYGSHVNLELFDVSDNSLTGSVPAWVGATGFGKLQTFRASNNALSGTLPSRVVNGPALVDVRLDGNALSGPVPARTKLMPNSTTVAPMSALLLQNNAFNCLLPAVYKKPPGTDPFWCRQLDGDGALTFSIDGNKLACDATALSWPFACSLPTFQKLAPQRVNLTDGGPTTAALTINVDSADMFAGCTQDNIICYLNEQRSPFAAATFNAASDTVTCTVDSEGNAGVYGISLRKNVQGAPTLNLPPPAGSTNETFVVSFERTCVGNCSGHGKCNDQFGCICELEWQGSECQYRRCPRDCFQSVGHGLCISNATGGDCNGQSVAGGSCCCYSGWRGLDCSIPRLSCPIGLNNTECSGNARGECNFASGLCQCKAANGKFFIGDACQYIKCPGAFDLPCSGHGICDNTTGICDCDYLGGGAAWATPDNGCRFLDCCPLKAANDPTPCCPNGFCDATAGKCSCYASYTDKTGYKDVDGLAVNCSGCACSRCKTDDLSDPADCSNHGTCVYRSIKKDSEGALLDPFAVSAFGRLGDCECDPLLITSLNPLGLGTYDPPYCLVPKLPCPKGDNGLECSGPTAGFCDPSSGTCSCLDNAFVKYEGPACEVRGCPKTLFNCNPNPRNGTSEPRGVCVNGTCVCSPGLYGPLCLERSCPLSEDLSECSSFSGRGACDRKTGACTCNEGRSKESACLKLVCPNSNSKTECGGHGECKGGTCVCYTGWEGEGCSVESEDHSMTILGIAGAVTLVTAGAALAYVILRKVTLHRLIKSA